MCGVLHSCLFCKAVQCLSATADFRSKAPSMLTDIGIAAQGIPFEPADFDPSNTSDFLGRWMPILTKANAGPSFRKAASHGGAVWLSAACAMKLAANGQLTAHQLFAETTVLNGVRFALRSTWAMLTTRPSSTTTPASG